MRIPKPFPRNSAYTPFLRRFTDERATDLADTKMLYNNVNDLLGFFTDLTDTFHTLTTNLFRAVAGHF